MERIVLSLRAQPNAQVRLLPTPYLPRQVESNRRARAFLDVSHGYDPNAPVCSDILIINLCVNGQRMRVDSAEIIVRFFAPKTLDEKYALREAEAAVMTAVRNRDKPGQERWNAARLAYANELLWLAVTGNLKSEAGDYLQEIIHMEIVRDLFENTGERGTWNSFEPE